MEALHLDGKASVTINCVSWIESVNERVKIFKEILDKTSS